MRKKIISKPNRIGRTTQPTRYYYRAHASAWDFDEEGNRTHSITGEKTNISNSKLLEAIRSDAINKAYTLSNEITNIKITYKLDVSYRRN